MCTGSCGSLRSTVAVKLPEPSPRRGVSDRVAENALVVLPVRVGPGAHLVGLSESEMEALIRDNHAALRRFVWQMVGADADDVLQDAYLDAFRAAPRFRKAEGSPVAWLYRIAYRKAISALRRRSVRANVTAALMALRAGYASGPSVNSIGLKGALAALPVEQRATVLLVDAIGLSYAEASAVLGVAEGTVGSRLNTARSALRSALEHEDTT
jgi:RNA polymerase sigma-70 factor, ECF subfamily